MATSFALVHVLILSLFLTSFFNPLSTTTTITAMKPRRLAAKLIRCDLLHSPLFYSSATLSDRTNLAYRISIARFAYIQAKVRGNSTLIADDIQVELGTDNDGVQFLANISMGTPPVPTLLHMDIGSDLLWVQCLLCTNCYNQSFPIFDPSKSWTFAYVSCDSPYCNILSPDKACDDSSHHCNFEYEYLDESKSKGNLATDVLTLGGSSDEGLTTLPNIVFGCGHDQNTGESSRSRQEAGVLGLGYSNRSLVSQLHSNGKFSYCLGNITDPFYAYNHLVLGTGARIEGCATPMDMYNGSYYLNLEDISVGTKRLQIKPGTFDRTESGTGGVIVDSGTTFSLLAPDGYGALSDEVTELLDKFFERVTVLEHQGQICYKGNAKHDLAGFPNVTFHFAQGAELVLDHESMFEQEKGDIFCMAILISGFDDVSIIGTMAQQHYNVGFDLDGKTISFERIDCELIV